MSVSQTDGKSLSLIAKAKEEQIAFVRSWLIDHSPAYMPDTSITVEQFTTAVTQYVNTLADEVVIGPLFTISGPQAVNLDSQGKSRSLLSLCAQYQAACLT